MPNISQENRFVTQINTIKVDPKNQARLVELMTEQARNVMAKLPGFISITLHRSVDGERVVNYAQWQSKELLDAAHDTPEFKASLAKYQPLTIEGGPHIHDITLILEAD